MDPNKFYLTNVRLEAFKKEIEYLEGEGSVLLAKLLASSPGSGMGRPNDLPAHILAGEVMGYLHDIKAIVRQAVIIDELRDESSDPDKVVVGSTVSVVYEGDPEVVEYTILGQKEVDIDEGRISCLSPIGSALLGCRKGDEISVKLNEQTRPVRMKVLKVERKPLDFEYSTDYWKDRIEQALLMETKN